MKEGKWKDLKQRLFRPLPNWLGKWIRIIEIFILAIILCWILVSLFLWTHELIFPGSVID